MQTKRVEVQEVGRDGISRLDWLRRGRAGFQGKSQATLLNWTGGIDVEYRHVMKYCIATIKPILPEKGKVTFYQRKKEKRHNHKARKTKHPTRNVLIAQAPPFIFLAPLPCTTVTVAGGGAAEEATDDAGTFWVLDVVS